MLGMIPLPYRILAAVLIVIGAFVFGYMKGLKVGEDKIKLFQAEAKAKYEKLQHDLEVAKNTVNTKIVTEYVDKIIYITKWRTKNVEIIKEVPSNCELSNGWVHVHDASVSSTNADRTAAADGTSSGIKDTEALETVVDNYGACAANTEKLKSWQKWYTEQQTVVGKINRENGVEAPSESTAPPIVNDGSSGLIQR
jgi:hypothetical protein